MVLEGFDRWRKVLMGLYFEGFAEKFDLSGFR